MSRGWTWDKNGAWGLCTPWLISDEAFLHQDSTCICLLKHLGEGCTAASTERGFKSAKKYCNVQKETGRRGMSVDLRQIMNERAQCRVWWWLRIVQEAFSVPQPSAKQQNAFLGLQQVELQSKICPGWPFLQECHSHKMKSLPLFQWILKSPPKSEFLPEFGAYICVVLSTQGQQHLNVFQNKGN